MPMWDAPTFYAHFESLDQLLLSGFEPLRVQFEDFLSGTTFDIESPWALGLAMFQQVQKQRRLHHIDAHPEILTWIPARSFETGSAKETKISRLNYWHTMSLIAFIALMTWWIDNNYPIPAEKMNEYYRQLVEPGTMAIMMGA
ncbi:hypothetical protein [Candidatus Villigracilis affinis]|uniref:hypothetical protein n=1 Tax=Candidatus Villigracilis affinis TaxID=3140682 RepID=UPI002A1E8610|nr:hypothetical protein [Anaerolineales bacterium]